MSVAKAVLVGNGINNILPGNSWAELLTDLQREFGGGNHLLSTHKQFPLFYEEILAFARGEGRSNPEMEIKEFISKKIKLIKPNELYSSFLALNCTDYLTTNYDFCLELVRDPLFKLTTNLGEIDESRYSLFRHFGVKNTRVWHIHGDAAHPSSISLGYEQYAGYLQNMRNYVVLGLAYQKRHYQPLIKRAKNNDHEIHSWIDVVFNKDLHIVGLSLDFVEIHLWWLLTFLARRGREGHKKISYNRSIYYYVPSYHVDEDSPKLRIMESLGVNVVRVTARSDRKEKYYSDVASRIDTA